MLNSKNVESDYEALLRYAQRAYRKGKFPLLFSCIETLAHWLYHTNLKFSAPELDKLIRDASFNLGLDVCEAKGTPRKVVFIDYFAWDNKGLTEQYLSALLGMNMDVLYINLNEEKIFKSSNILKLLDASKCEVMAFSKAMSVQDKILLSYNAISLFSPSHVFFHTAPWDIVSPALCCFFPSLIKLNINITDHAFWLGVAEFDYVLNFREYGAYVSTSRRRMSAEQQLFVPMYPVIPNGVPSILPFTKNENSTVLVTGGAFYKVIDDSNHYLNLMASVLIENPDSFLYFIGSGDSSSIKGFISDNRLEGRLFLLEERADFFEVLKASDIYVGTYPVGGGLMTQYCALAGLPFVALKDKEDSTDKLLSVLRNRPKYKVLFDSVDDCRKEINKLISDKGYRSLRSDDFFNCAPSKEKFDSAVKEIINGPLVSQRHAVYAVGCDGGYSDVSLKGNQKVIKYYLIPLMHMRVSLLLFSPVLFCRSLFSLFKRFLG